MCFIDYYLNSKSSSFIFTALIPCVCLHQTLECDHRVWCIPLLQRICEAHNSAFTIFPLGPAQGRKLINLFLRVISLSPIWIDGG